MCEIIDLISKHDWNKIYKIHFSIISFILCRASTNCTNTFYSKFTHYTYEKKVSDWLSKAKTTFYALIIFPVFLIFSRFFFTLRPFSRLGPSGYPVGRSIADGPEKIKTHLKTCAPCSCSLGPRNSWWQWRSTPSSCPGLWPSPFCPCPPGPSDCRRGTNVGPWSAWCSIGRSAAWWPAGQSCPGIRTRTCAPCSFAWSRCRHCSSCPSRNATATSTRNPTRPCSLNGTRNERETGVVNNGNNYYQ